MFQPQGNFNQSFNQYPPINTGQTGNLPNQFSGYNNVGLNNTFPPQYPPSYNQNFYNQPPPNMFSQNNNFNPNPNFTPNYPPSGMNQPQVYPPGMLPFNPLDFLNKLQ